MELPEGLDGLLDEGPFGVNQNRISTLKGRVICECGDMYDAAVIATTLNWLLGEYLMEDQDA